MTAKKSTKTETTAPANVLTGEALAIWEEISAQPLSLWGLPNQTVEKHVSNPLPIPGGILVRLSSSGVLPALEQALEKFQVKDEGAAPRINAAGREDRTPRMKSKYLLDTADGGYYRISKND